MSSNTNSKQLGKSVTFANLESTSIIAGSTFRHFNQFALDKPDYEVFADNNNHVLGDFRSRVHSAFNQQQLTFESGKLVNRPVVVTSQWSDESYHHHAGFLLAGENGTYGLRVSPKYQIFPGRTLDPEDLESDPIDIVTEMEERVLDVTSIELPEGARIIMIMDLANHTLYAYERSVKVAAREKKQLHQTINKLRLENNQLRAGNGGGAAAAASSGSGPTPAEYAAANVKIHALERELVDAKREIKQLQDRLAGVNNNNNDSSDSDNHNMQQQQQQGDQQQIQSLKSQLDAALRDAANLRATGGHKRIKELEDQVNLLQNERGGGRHQHQQQQQQQQHASPSSSGGGIPFITTRGMLPPPQFPENTTSFVTFRSMQSALMNYNETVILQKFLDAYRPPAANRAFAPPPSNDMIYIRDAVLEALQQLVSYVNSSGLSATIPDATWTDGQCDLVAVLDTMLRLVAMCTCNISGPKLNLIEIERRAQQVKAKKIAELNKDPNNYNPTLGLPRLVNLDYFYVMDQALQASHGGSGGNSGNNNNKSSGGNNNKGGGGGGGNNNKKSQSGNGSAGSATPKSQQH